MAHEKYIELGPSASSLVSAVNEFLTTRDRSKQSLISCSQDVWAVGYAIEKLQSEYGRARQRALDYALGLVKTFYAASASRDEVTIWAREGEVKKMVVLTNMAEECAEGFIKVVTPPNQHYRSHAIDIDVARLMADQRDKFPHGAHKRNLRRQNQQ